jgi:hypothetical protein
MLLFLFLVAVSVGLAKPVVPDSVLCSTARPDKFCGSPCWCLLGQYLELAQTIVLSAAVYKKCYIYALI